MLDDLFDQIAARESRESQADMIAATRFLAVAARFFASVDIGWCLWLECLYFRSLVFELALSCGYNSLKTEACFRAARPRGHAAVILGRCRDRSKLA